MDNFDIVHYALSNCRQLCRFRQARQFVYHSQCKHEQETQCDRIHEFKAVIFHIIHPIALDCMSLNSETIASQ